MTTSHRERGPLPIVVGVTGHRDLRRTDIIRLEELVRGVFVELRQRYPHSPLLMLSPLAEGSDRLVARVARKFGAHLFAPLPLPRDLYESDFDRPESRVEFDELMAAAESSFELPLFNGNTTAGISTPGGQRNRQYAQLGVFIARHSQVFLALWDGQRDDDGNKVGGTAEVVRYRLEGASLQDDPTASPLNVASSGPVIHIVTPREGRPVPENALTRRVLMPSRQTVGQSDDLPASMDHFNRDVLEHWDGMLRRQTASKAQLLQVPESEVPQREQAFPPAARLTLDHYAAADSLALQFATRTHAATRQLFGWVFAAALFFNVFHSMPHPHLSEEPTLMERLTGMPWLLLAFLAASLIATFRVQRRAEEEDYQNKHQDYRALAEALRIQFFWRVAGLPDAVVDHYLRKQRGALEWIRNALRSWDVETSAYYANESDPESMTGRLNFVAQNWVTEQRNYYASRARREHHALEKDERQIRTLVRLSVGIALLLALGLTLPVVVPWHPLEEIKHLFEDPWIHGVVMVAIVTLAVAAGLRHGYNQQMARSEHAKQYSRMSELFGRAEQHLATLLQAGDSQRAKELLQELGAEALEENGDWVLLHRERPLEVPHSG
jgi:hypothetical protein